ncbi:MAG TPA: carbohydrate-binding module family 20 domain-containing protein [Saprospiraceae bacterium]|nr:carbohydrate-binding module family 20 domain-containing protein [Saprospiraceae bacterium]
MIKKQYLKSKPVCKVTFTLPVTALAEAKEVRVVGDFNNWNWEEGTPMKAGKKEYKATLNLATGRNYEFRYIAEDGTWENDWEADAYVPSPYYGVDNSIVQVEEVLFSKKGSGEAAPKNVPSAKAANPTAKPKKKATKKAKKDNLKTIEGIGPKIEKLLTEKGVDTFAKLAKAKPAFLKEVLAEAGSRFKMHDPSTWPEQAALAAKGDKKALDALQEKLKGGKR